MMACLVLTANLLHFRVTHTPLTYGQENFSVYLFNGWNMSFVCQQFLTYPSSNTTYVQHFQYNVVLQIYLHPPNHLPLSGLSIKSFLAHSYIIVLLMAKRQTLRSMVKDIECFKRKEEEDEEEEVLLFTDNRYSSVNRKMNEKSWSLRDLH